MTLILVLSDQYSKSYYINLFETSGNFEHEMLPFFNIVYVWNKGVSFGFLSGWIHSNILFIAISTLITWYFLKLFLRETNFKLKLSYGLIIGGAVGNIIDRIRYGAVFDFIDVHVKNLHWPAFNLADSFITVGAILLISSLFSGKIGKSDKTEL